MLTIRKRKVLYYVKKLNSIIFLSMPFVVSRLGLFVLDFVDTIMLGHYSADDLAYKSIGSSFTYLIVGATIGLLTGTLVLSAVEYGKKNFSLCGDIWKHSVFYGQILGFLFLFLCLFGRELLSFSGQNDELSLYGGEVIKIIGYGMPFIALFVSCSSFLEAVRKSHIATISIILANIINIFLNWVFVYGKFGFEEMGASGSAWATTITRTSLGIFVLSYIVFSKEMKKFEILKIRKRIFVWNEWKKLRNFGYGTAFAMLAEEFSFFVTVQYAGWISKLAVSVYVIGLNVLTATFMIAIGLGSATASQIGKQRGQRRYKKAVREGWFGLLITIIFMSVATLFICLYPRYIARIYTSDELLIKNSIPVLMILGFVFILDGWQALMGNALRGFNDIWYPTIIQTISYMLILLPTAYYFGVFLNQGALGLFKGSIFASIVAASLLTTRYIIKTRGYR